MKRNLLVLAILLVASAVAARYRPEDASQEQRLEKGLCALWGSPNNHVEIQAGGDLWVTVFMPPGGTEERENWNFQLVRWLAARDPRIVCRELRVTDGSGRGRLRERPLSEPMDLQRRNLQKVADGLMGQGETLVLLEREQPTVGPPKAGGGLRGQGCVVVMGDAPAPLLKRLEAGHPGLHLRLVKVPKS
ncbi:MAG: hypothetical protein J0I12_02155 [Candidatus Eremiobacteraeota bacterium]|nr:hypothetical protein [Candidatus Eremiobacteraeota bacterium]